jgi:hypothetical protein
MAEDTVGVDGHTARAVPLDRLVESFEKYRGPLKQGEGAFGGVFSLDTIVVLR